MNPVECQLTPFQTRPGLYQSHHSMGYGMQPCQLPDQPLTDLFIPRMVMISRDGPGAHSMAGWKV